MMKKKIQKYFEQSAPEADFSLMRGAVLERIKQYDADRAEEKLFLVPKTALYLLWASFFFGAYGFFQETLLQVLYLAPKSGGVSFAVVGRTLAATLDNIAIMGLTLSLIAILEPRFMKIRKAYETGKSFFKYTKTAALYLPSAAWGLMKRIR
jgi:hypothetical protein